MGAFEGIVTQRRNAISCGDVMGVPGLNSNLFRAKAQGADVRIAYPPVEALKFTKANTDRKVVLTITGTRLLFMAWLVTLAKQVPNLELPSSTRVAPHHLRASF